MSYFEIGCQKDIIELYGKFLVLLPFFIFSFFLFNEIRSFVGPWVPSMAEKYHQVEKEGDCKVELFQT